jgi:hypothetical protein
MIFPERIWRLPVAALLAFVSATGIGSLLLVGASQAEAASSSQFLQNANAICHAASRDLDKALNIGGDTTDPSQIRRGFTGEGRAFAWEAQAFKRLAAPAWAIHAGYKDISLAYRYAGDELKLAVEEDNLGDGDQSQLDIDYSQRAARTGNAKARELGIRGCGNE